MNKDSNRNKKAFTLIELLVVIAIIGVLATLAIVALQNSRANARDSKRLADIKQVQTALELYFNDNKSYPTSVTSTIATGSTIYMAMVPTAPIPVDGSCSSGDNTYTYSSDGSTYSILFCLGSRVGGTDAGKKEASASGVSNYVAPPAPWACGEVLTDSRDSQQYTTVLIGTQCWMAKNMNYDDGCASNTWVNSSDTRWCSCYNGISGNCVTYGKLYQWSAAMAGSATEGAQGICPTGWHVPGSAELTTLSTYSGGDSVAGGKLKQVGTSTWWSPNAGAANAYNFNGLPAGYRYLTGSYFNSLGERTYLWSSSISGPNASRRGLSYMSADFGSNFDSQLSGYSVRCLKN